MPRRLIISWLVGALLTIPAVISSQVFHTGGPDSLGYHWIDSDTTGGLAFDWVDISSLGALGPTGDDKSSLVSLPFPFWFYGRFNTKVHISTNGYLTFSEDATDYSNDPIPGSLEPNNYIAPYWCDLAAGANGSTIHYYHDVNQNNFIVQYTDIPVYNSGGSSTFQVILNADASIVFQYLRMTRTVFLSGNLDASLVPVANRWSSEVPFLLASDSSNAYFLTDLNDLAQIVTPLIAGDIITLAGTDPSGMPISSTFTYSLDGTTLRDLLSAIDSAWRYATATLYDGKIILTDNICIFFNLIHQDIRIES